MFTASKAYTFLANGTCLTYRYAFRGMTCEGSVSGFKPPPPPPPPGTPGAPCTCKRVNQVFFRHQLRFRTCL